MEIQLTIPAALAAQLELAAVRFGLAVDALASRLLVTPLADLLDPKNIPEQDLADLAGVTHSTAAD